MGAGGSKVSVEDAPGARQTAKGAALVGGQHDYGGNGRIGWSSFAARNRS